jgi:YVTN family beta-propeller protein
MATTELDLRAVPAAEVFATLRSHYLALAPGDRLRAILAHDPSGPYMGFLEAGIRHQIGRIGDGEWEWTGCRTAWEPIANGPGIHHIAISPDCQRLYAVDRDRSVFSLDTANLRVVARAGVQPGTSHLAVHPSSGHVYVAEGHTDTMARLDGEGLGLRGRLPVGRHPHLPAVTSDGRVVILPGGNGMLTLAYDDDELRAEALHIGGRPSASTVSADGRRAYVPDPARNLLVTVDLEQGQVLGETPVGDGPAHPVVTPDDRWVCVANSRSHDVSLIDAATLQVVATVPSGEAAHQTSLTPDGQILLVANFFADPVSVIDVLGRTALAVLPVGPYPHGLDVSPDGRWAIATHFGDEWVSIIAVSQRSVITRVPAGLGSSHTAFAPDGDWAYVANSIAHTITVVDLRTLEAISEVKMP